MGQLRISPHKSMTLIWWWKNRDKIDFGPSYQRRGRLWSSRDKAYLIDTIINGFDVPKLYIADFQFGQSQLNSAKMPYAIIDGKQRLEAVFDFFENKITLNDDFIYKKETSFNLGKLSYRDLQSRYPRIADEFDNASLDFMSVFSDDEEDIHEIFIRLNKSKPLTGAEVRNAIPGPVSEIIRALSMHEFFTETINFGVGRAGDRNAAAKVLYFEFHHKPMPTKKTDLDRFAKIRDPKAELELAGRRAIDTLSAMNEVFIPRDRLLSSAGQLPVYYWLVRSIRPEFHRHTREFLLWFEDSRKKNRDRQKGRSGALDLDQRLSRYDTLNRSTNDLQSHNGRIDLLKDHFVDWINAFILGPVRTPRTAFRKDQIFIE
ncbi:hypothetical protein IP81_10755 [Novosphingobium sp. AAP83]|uniref:DUF262 domain-containing protein n=1 Tax=Novosphingobium sp. AAP83 TaxID=1523425 RepID=UPI0006B8BCDF|nr:DUF262 domain-containing protein [Novosphingobium sp. AAP83]KPF91395.1 hypothetical protein IP81_10755 [Novosphingobium sp. AAP83]